MKQLNKVNNNKPDLAYNFFKNRWRSQMHYCDWNRFVLLAKDFKGGKYLDVGCFNSPMPYELTRDFPEAEIYALDYCEPLIKELQERYPEVKYVVGDAKKLPFKDGEFDYVVAGELLEHCENPSEVLKELARVVKVGGTLAVSVPLNESENEAISDEHLWSFSAEDLVIMLMGYGETSLNFYEDNYKLIIGKCVKQNYEKRN
jgi:ubiquinone/menaquinone biosynthesis C-methylase UbiE